MDQEQLNKTIIAQAAIAKLASRKLANLSSDDKNKILLAIADALLKQKGFQGAHA